ncbi:MAG: hypothetical protein NTU41_00570, partial [Chloroflexi bacterium]|nr:hypothetical protein [Chloroflexota bacterium]
MAKSRERERLPPYLTYATWRRVIDALEQHMPSQFDETYWADLQVSASTGVTIRSTLNFLGLVDA